MNTNNTKTPVEFLIYFQPMFHFYTPPKTLKNSRFPEVFKGYRSETLIENGLICVTGTINLVVR